MQRRLMYTLCLMLIFAAGLWAQAQQPPKPTAPAPANPAQSKPTNPTPANPAPAKTSEPVAAMQAAGFKIGFIDLERALLQVEEGKKEFGDLEKFVKDKENEAKGKQDTIEKQRQQLTAQDKNLKDDAKAQIQRDIDSKMTELERFTQDTQREIDARRTAAINKIGNKMQPIINALAKDQAYAAILVYSPSSPLYAYIDLEKYDVTNAVIERYNKTASPAAAAQPASPPASPAPAQPKTAKK